jgi:hypothetical protein
VTSELKYSSSHILGEMIRCATIRARHTRFNFILEFGRRQIRVHKMCAHKRFSLFTKRENLSKLQLRRVYLKERLKKLAQPFLVHDSLWQLGSSGS